MPKVVLKNQSESNRQPGMGFYIQTQSTPEPNQSVNFNTGISFVGNRLSGN